MSYCHALWGEVEAVDERRETNRMWTDQWRPGSITAHIPAVSSHSEHTSKYNVIHYQNSIQICLVFCKKVSTIQKTSTKVMRYFTLSI